MSDKTIGVLGQKYKNRKTGEVGTLQSRYDEKSALEFVNDFGESFVVSYGVFKSSWRKYTDDTKIKVVENTVAETPEVAVKDISLEKFEKELKSSKVTVDVNKNVTTISKEGFIVAKITENKKTKSFHLDVMPDVYTYSRQRKQIIMPGSIHFDTRFVDNLSVSFDTVKTSIETVFGVIKDSIKNLNLYGYIIED